MLRKSKKCVNCGKPFGVFTFGRRQCTNCDHINLARMAVCFKCGQSLDKAPTAVPKITESKTTMIKKMCQVATSGDNLHYT